MQTNQPRPWPGAPNYANYSKEALQYLLQGLDNDQLLQDIGVPRGSNLSEALKLLTQQDNKRETRESFESLLMRFKGRIDIDETISNDIPLVISHDVFFLPMINWVCNFTYLLIQLNSITYGILDTNIYQIAEQLGIKHILKEELISERDLKNIIQYLSATSKQFKFYIHENKFPDPNAFKSYGLGNTIIHLLMWNNFLHPVQMSYDSWQSLNESMKRQGVRYCSIDYVEIAKKKKEILSKQPCDILQLASNKQNNQRNSIKKNQSPLQFLESYSNEQSKSAKKYQKGQQKLGQQKSSDDSDQILKIYLEILKKVKKYANYNYTYQNIMEREWEADTFAFIFKKSFMFFVNDASKSIFGYHIETIVSHKNYLTKYIQKVIETQLYFSCSVSTISSLSRQSISQFDQESVDRSDHSFTNKFEMKCQIKE